MGKLFASLLKLPLWLDCIGTCIGACLGGPVIGGICGAANSLIFGLTTGDNITLVYALTSFGIGLAAVLISTPLNIMFWGGTTGNVWGDACFGDIYNRGKGGLLKLIIPKKA